MRREDEPTVPENTDLRELPRAVRAELRGLPVELADLVAAHLVMAGKLIETDPQTAFAHAEAARRRASRLPIAREASAETAYAAGEYAHALNEYRALRRMTGGTEYLPVMADCERALGRPQAALRLAREAADLELTPDAQVEMIIVEAGARDDLGQGDEARRLLRSAVERIRRPAMPAARLRYAYADLLLADGDTTAAHRFFAEAADLDPDGEIDSIERVDELEGMVIDFDETDDEPAAPLVDEDGDIVPELPDSDDSDDDDEPADDEPSDDEPGDDEPADDEPEQVDELPDFEHPSAPDVAEQDR